MADATNEAVSADDLLRVLVDVTREAGTALGEIADMARRAMVDAKARKDDKHSTAIAETLNQIWPKAERAQDTIAQEAQEVDCYFHNEADAKAAIEAIRSAQPARGEPAARAVATRKQCALVFHDNASSAFAIAHLMTMLQGCLDEEGDGRDVLALTTAIDALAQRIGLLADFTGSTLDPVLGVRQGERVEDWMMSPLWHQERAKAERTVEGGAA